MQSWWSRICDFRPKNISIHRKQNSSMCFKRNDLGQVKAKGKEVGRWIIRRLKSTLITRFIGVRIASCRIGRIKENLCQIHIKRLQFKKASPFIRKNQINWNSLSCSRNSQTEFENLCNLFRYYLWGWLETFPTLFYVG